MFINFFHWASELPWDQINWELIGSVYLDGIFASMVLSPAPSYLRSGVKDNAITQIRVNIPFYNQIKNLNFTP